MSLFEIEVLKINKEKVTAMMLSCMLLISIGITFHRVKANSNNPIVFTGGVTIYSPVNTTYHTNSLTLNLTCGCGAGLHISLNYDIDGKYHYPISLTFNLTSGFHIIGLGTGSVKLPKLPSGSHCLTIYEEAYLYDYYDASPPGAPFEETATGSADFIASWVDKVYFTIDSSVNLFGSTPSNNSIPSPISSETPSTSVKPTSTPTATPHSIPIPLPTTLVTGALFFALGLGLLIYLVNSKGKIFKVRDKTFKIGKLFALSLRENKNV